MPPKLKPPVDDESALPRLGTIVPPFYAHTEADALENKTAKRIYELMKLINDGTQALSERANQAAADAVEHSEQVNQALLSTKDAMDAQADFLTVKRINLDNAENLADTNAGAQTVTSNFRRVYLDEHPATIADLQNTVNPIKLTIAAKQFMTVERVLVIVDALLAAWPVEVFQHILIKAAGQPVERVLVIVKALLAVQPVAIIEYILASASLTDFDQAARGVKNVRLGKVIHELMKSAQKWGL